MAFYEPLAERIRQALARKKGVEEKKMFGGVGFLLNGNMLVGVWKDSLIVRLGPDEGEEALKEPHVKEFDITGRPMKGWVLVQPEGVAGDDRPAADEGRDREAAGGSAEVRDRDSAAAVVSKETTRQERSHRWPSAKPSPPASGKN